jgi:hypothetical protein
MYHTALLLQQDCSVCMHEGVGVRGFCCLRGWCLAIARHCTATYLLKRNRSTLYMLRDRCCYLMCGILI